MRTIKEKLHSQCGASITYALLLFLVCAVIGSVVLAAGTASAGRFSGLMEADQRYYNVTSAANLFRDLFDGNSVTITRERTYTERTVQGHVRTTVNGTVSLTNQAAFALPAGVSAPAIQTDYPQDPRYLAPSIQKSYSTESAKDLVQILSTHLVFGAGTYTGTAAETKLSWSNTLPVADSIPQSMEFQFTGEGLTDAEKEILQGSITASQQADGTILLTITNTNGPHFQIQMVLKADIVNHTKRPSTKVVSTVVVETVVNTETITTEEGEEEVSTETVKYNEYTDLLVTETKTTTIKWTVGEISVIGGTA